jgi:hypothetical protein
MSPACECVCVCVENMLPSPFPVNKPCHAMLMLESGTLGPDAPARRRYPTLHCQWLHDRNIRAYGQPSLPFSPLTASTPVKDTVRDV